MAIWERFYPERKLSIVEHAHVYTNNLLCQDEYSEKKKKIGKIWKTQNEKDELLFQLFLNISRFHWSRMKTKN